MTYFQPRILFLIIFIGCASLLSTAIFLDPFKNMIPCPMCMMQRAFFVSLGIVALIAAIHGAKNWGQKVYAFIIVAFSMGGASVAIRQLWLQSLPEDQVPACGPGLDYMLDVFPISEVVMMALRGTGDCAKVQWTFLHLSIAGWSLLAFVAVAAVCFSIIFKNRSK